MPGDIAWINDYQFRVRVGKLDRIVDALDSAELRDLATELSADGVLTERLESFIMKQIRRNRIY